MMHLWALACGSHDAQSTSIEVPTDTASSSDCAEGPLASDLAVALVTVWGTGPDDVWMAGADDGTGPLVLHWDGTTWSREQTGLRGDLWWGLADGVGGHIVVGEGAVVATRDASGTWSSEVIADPAYTLFGAYGAPETWAVAGDASGTLPGLVLARSGDAWSTVLTATPALNGTQRSAFKVAGQGDERWVVGSGGLVAHGDTGGIFEMASIPGEPSLTTVASGSTAYAVGGLGNAVALRWDGAAWQDDNPDTSALAPRFVGVATTSDGGAIAVGDSGARWFRDPDPEGTWSRESCPPLTPWGFHAVWQDGAGGTWAVGGDLFGLTSGVVALWGRDDVPEYVP